MEHSTHVAENDASAELETEGPNGGLVRVPAKAAHAFPQSVVPELEHQDHFLEEQNTSSKSAMLAWFYRLSNALRG